MGIIYRALVTGIKVNPFYYKQVFVPVTCHCRSFVSNVMAAEKRPSAENNDVSHENTCKKIKIESQDESEFMSIKTRRRMHAVLLSYCGKGYYGMQRNPGAELHTIEGELLSAMLKANVIDRDTFDHPQSMWFQRAARTDKGVSAARQIVCMKIGVDENTVNDINQYLPDQIRVVAMKKAKKKFNAKCHCDARTYTYVCPTMAFAHLEQIVSEDFRITDDMVQEIQSILDMYVGSHYYHNFTSGKKAGEDSARRFIMDFKLGKPFVRENMEFVALTVKGQSFMLHQIRKMVAMVIAIMRGFATKKTLIEARKIDKLDIPIAPGLGLFLESVHYDKYNQRFLNDGIHEQLTWDEFDNVVNDVKENYIYKTIIEGEVNEKSMMKWLDNLYLHDFKRRPTGGVEYEKLTKTSYDHAVLTLTYNYGEIPKDDSKLPPQEQDENNKDNPDIPQTDSKSPSPEVLTCESNTYVLESKDTDTLKDQD